MISLNTTLSDASLAQGFLYFVGVFFILYLIGYSTFLFLSVTVGSSVLYRRKREERFKNQLIVDYFVPITIIVPAHNENITVIDSLRSMISLDYPLYEIVVVDDGSVDNTAQLIVDKFGLHEIDKPIRYQVPCMRAEKVWEGTAGKIPLTLISKPNGGKSDALNLGINAARYPYFICVDADSVLQEDSLKEISAPIVEQHNVVAVGGLVRLSNGVKIQKGRVLEYSLPKKIIPAMQVLEYDRSFLSARILFDRFNGNLIISGAFGLFKKDTVIAAGGYDRSTVGEDMELVTKLHVFCRTNKLDYCIRYCPNAICWTQAPASLHDLMRQRRRWHRGLIECMTKHWRIFANLHYGPVSLLSYTYYLVYELFSPFIEIFGIATMVIAFIYNFINVPFMIFFFLIYAFFGSVMSLTAFFSRIQTRDLSISKHDVVKALCLSLVEITFIRFVLAVTRMYATVTYRKKKHSSWEKVTRIKIDTK